MKVGIQLYSVRNNMAKDPLATIRKVAQQGYHYLEVANHAADQDFGVGFSVTPEEINGVLEETGASIVSVHIFPMDAKKIKPVLDYHQKIGTKFIVMPMDFYKDRSETLEKAKTLNEVGAECKKAGIQLVYHNHFHEFQVFEGETESIFETLMNNTDEQLVQIEIDTYWALRAGVDPIAFIKKYGKRIRLIHQKDFPKGLEGELNLLQAVHQNNTYVDMDYFTSVVNQNTFTEIGNGLIDIQGIIDAANEYADVEYIILEQDYTTYDEFESIKISMENFKKLQGITWK